MSAKQKVRSARALRHLRQTNPSTERPSPGQPLLPNPRDPVQRLWAFLSVRLEDYAKRWAATFDGDADLVSIHVVFEIRRGATTRLMEVVGDDCDQDPDIDNFAPWFKRGAIAVVEVGGGDDYIVLEVRVAGSRWPRFFRVNEDGLIERPREDGEDNL